MKKWILLGCTLWCGGAVFAQNDVDALRLAGQEPGYTARSWGMGGSIGALGADLSVAGINPAGLAQYRRGEGSFSLMSTFGKNTSTYFGQSTEENSFRLLLPQAGFVFADERTKNGKPITDGWANLVFGVSYHQSANFDRTTYIQGTNTQSSMADWFAQLGSGLTPGQIGATDDEYEYGFNYLETMAWEAYLIDSVGPKSYGAAQNSNYREQYQRLVLDEKGGVNDIRISLAGNYAHKLYIGASLNFSVLNYTSSYRFTEYDEPDDTANFTMLYLDRDLNISGTGVGLDVGLIYLPTENIRLGASFRTPMAYQLTDNYKDFVGSELERTQDNFYDFETLDGQYKYVIQSPMRTTVSAAVLSPKWGAFNADVEFLNYNNMRLKGENGESIGTFEATNDIIRNKYTTAINLRLGTELLFGDYRVRAGYANYGSPFNGNNLNQNQYFTLGFGIKERNYGLDFAYVGQLRKDETTPYNIEMDGAEAATNSFYKSRIMSTFTFRF